MASSKWIDEQFGQRLKERRKDKRWTQPQMAKMLADLCSQSIDPTTIAKIEAGKRSVRINEAVAIAALFEVSVDGLLGRQGPDDATLTLAMTTLMDYAGDAGRQIVEAQRTATDIDDQLENIEESFDPPHIKHLQHTAHDMTGHLKEARALATKLVHAASFVIVDAATEA